jgi:hypothetical protein
MIGLALVAKLSRSERRTLLRAALVVAAGFSAPLLPINFGKVSAQNLHLVVIVGLGGDAEYRSQFTEWGTTLVEAAIVAGVPAANVVFLAENPESAPQVIDGPSTRIEVERVIGEIARRAAIEDEVLVVLIGHGGGSGGNSRVSLPGGSAGGGSLTASDYASLLATLTPRRVAFVNLASSSGDFVPILASSGRVIVTATRSASQRNAPLFGGHFVTAFSGTGADLDRDSRVSILEAFEYARQETERHYREEGLIATEHALIEDRIEGSGVNLPMDAADVGALASRFFLKRAAPATSNPATAARLRELYAEQDRLEDSLADLTLRSGAMPAADYQAALEPILVELARIGQEIRRLEGAP